MQRGHGNASTFKCSNGGPPCLFEQSSCHFGKKVGQAILSALSGAVAEGLKKVSGDTSSLSPSVADNPESVLKELAHCLRRTHSGISALNNIVVNSLYTGILLYSDDAPLSKTGRSSSPGTHRSREGDRAGFLLVSGRKLHKTNTPRNISLQVGVKDVWREYSRKARFRLGG